MAIRLSALIVLALALAVSALKHKLTISKDARELFKIETFGFLEGGSFLLDINDFQIHEPLTEGPKPHNKHMRRLDETPPGLNKVGFVFRRAETESGVQQDMETLIEKNLCMIDELSDLDDIFIDMSDPHSWKHSAHKHEFSVHQSGLYSFAFVRCAPKGPAHAVSFTLTAEFVNPGPNYLSAGDYPLPTVYFNFFIAFSVAAVVWYIVLRRAPAKRAAVHHIHHMMLALVVLKCVTLLLESIRYHYISIFGVSEMWSILYYIFAFFKGVMLFTVILLIGSGWSLMKSYLLSREKQVIAIVLTLQVIDNIAMVVLEESSPGSQSWLTWRDILHLVDIACCCAILFPIVWSINHMQQGASADGKANNNVLKLKVFREFYMSVVVFIYFTRIIVYLMAASLPYHWLWMSVVATEFVTLVFYTYTGYKFQPVTNNPYFEVAREDHDELVREYGLEDNDVELTTLPGSNKL